MACHPKVVACVCALSLCRWVSDLFSFFSVFVFLDLLLLGQSVGMLPALAPMRPCALCRMSQVSKLSKFSKFRQLPPARPSNAP